MPMRLHVNLKRSYLCDGAGAIAQKTTILHNFTLRKEKDILGERKIY